jgi:flagella basal body P-ring formation protein FlgA
MPVPSGRLKFDRRMLGKPDGRDGFAMWRGSVVYDGAKTVPFWAKVRIRIRQRLVRAARVIPANSVLQSADLKESEEETAFTSEGAPPLLPELVGKETRREIQPGEIVRSASVRNRNDIQRGQTVEVIVESGDARIKTEAKALNSGNRGGSVLLTNAASGRVFRAQVTGPGAAGVQSDTQSNDNSNHTTFTAGRLGGKPRARKGQQKAETGADQPD